MTGDAKLKNEMERFEEKRDELLDGLLEAYEAGYKQAIDDYDRLEELPEKEDVAGSEYIGQCNYYHWDGRTLPIEPWLREQFGIDINVGEPMTDADFGSVTSQSTDGNEQRPIATSVEIIDSQTDEYEGPYDLKMVVDHETYYLTISHGGSMDFKAALEAVKRGGAYTLADSAQDGGRDE